MDESLRLRRPVDQTMVKELLDRHSSDPGRTNELITLAYHDLALQLRAVLRHQGANFCAFATWASRTLRPLVTLRGKMRWLGALLAPVMSAVFWVMRRFRMGSAFRDGNVGLFWDLGPLITSFIAEVETHDAYESERFAEFLARSIPSEMSAVADDPRRPIMSEADPAPLLHALESWYRARFEEDVAIRAALVSAGNVAMANFEQARVQHWLDAGWLRMLRVIALAPLAVFVPCGRVLHRSDKCCHARRIGARWGPPKPGWRERWIKWPPPDWLFGRRRNCYDLPPEFAHAGWATTHRTSRWRRGGSDGAWPGSPRAQLEKPRAANAVHHRVL